MDKLEYQTFYSDLTGFPPYGYQIKVAELLLAGKNVILSVPTGAGKTWASIMPFLYAKQNKIDAFPQKMIYSLPLRTLANSIYLDVNKTLKNTNFENLSSIQTGEYCDDPHFEKEIIFSTIDQTLSNFLCFPLPLSQRQANINAGALIGSYLVFDEFHLLEPKLSMATSLGMLQLLGNLCRVCIMTATLTDDYIQFVKDKFGYEVVSIKDFPNDIEKIKSLKPAENKSVKKSVIVCPDKKINAIDILYTHKNKTIVICNRVEKAQQIYNDLYKSGKGIKKENIICLHSRFFDKDRKEKEEKLKNLFGKGSTENAILISTQVIEAGMDISCDTMHTEISPINSFLQRAGRCARFENEYGDIYVYDILDTEEKILIDADDEADKKEIKKLSGKYLPYDKELCEQSFSELSKYKSINDKFASELVNAVLKENEKQIINSITERIYNKDMIQESWRDCDKKHYRETIRDIQSVEIILIDLENSQNGKIIPWKYETVSVYKWSFIGWAKQLEEKKIDEDDWIFAKAEQSSDSCFDFEWQDKDAYFLKRLPVGELKNHYDMIFVDNRYFNYTVGAGFIVAQNDEHAVSPMKQDLQKEKQTIIFEKDTFYQHNKALLNCFEKEFKPYLKFLFHELEKFWGEKIDWEKLIKLAICFHDYGKLNIAWQKPMKEFQKRKSGIDNPHELLAHTDYDENTDKELGKECKIKQKPSHAGIGAIQAYEILFDKSEKIANIVANVILKHHSPKTQSSATYCISDTGIKEMTDLLKEYQIDGQLISKGKEELLDGVLNTPNEQIIYLFMVRILRLCDQKATESLEKYYQQ
jgi:CRISPR-associated endonuclease/helicase Cas3